MVAAAMSGRAEAIKRRADCCLEKRQRDRDKSRMAREPNDSRTSAGF
jgi:hypothetical protein